MVGHTYQRRWIVSVFTLSWSVGPKVVFGRNRRFSDHITTQNEECQFFDLPGVCRNYTHQQSSDGRRGDARVYTSPGRRPNTVWCAARTVRRGINTREWFAKFTTLVGGPGHTKITCEDRNRFAVRENSLELSKVTSVSQKQRFVSFSGVTHRQWTLPDPSKLG